MLSTLPIHERFHSFQGEGCHAGRAAFFIRTYGCPVHCPWCDSAGTWHPDLKPDALNRMDVAALAEEAAAARPAFVVVTGGEPAIHDLAPLTDALRAAGLPVHLETSGAFPVRGHFDWITLSPKRWKLPSRRAFPGPTSSRSSSMPPVPLRNTSPPAPRPRASPSGSTPSGTSLRIPPSLTPSLPG